MLSTARGWFCFLVTLLHFGWPTDHPELRKRVVRPHFDAGLVPRADFCSAVRRR